MFLGMLNIGAIIRRNKNWYEIDKKRNFLIRTSVTIEASL